MSNFFIENYEIHSSCNHTGFEDSPWWTVDLEATYKITEVVLTDRGCKLSICAKLTKYVVHKCSQINCVAGIACVHHLGTGELFSEFSAFEKM